VGVIAGPQGSKVKPSSMDMFLHQENLAIFKKRLEQPHTAKQHEILLRLQAEELTRDYRTDSRE
jgi:hypothetical protein